MLSSSPLENSTVLIIDDMPSMRAITKKVLKHYGVKKVLECENGKHGLTCLKVNRVDLVICDWDMPVMTGIELLIEVRKDQRLSQIPFIMLTANASRNFVVKCAEAKVNDHIVKPFQPQQFIDKVSKQLSRARTQESQARIA